MLKLFSNLNIGKKLLLGFAAVVLVFVILCTIVFVNLSNYITSNEWNEHTYKVLSDVDKIIASMINMETGQRGFSITGDEKFLEPYNKGKSDFDKYFDSFKELTSDNPKQQEYADKMKQLKESWQQTAENSINLRREVTNKIKPMDDVIKEELAAKGKQFMDSLRGVAAESINIETTLLEERSQNQENLENTTKAILIFGTLLGVILAVIVAYFVSKIITSGILKVTNAANKLATGDMNVEIDASTNDEIGNLANSFSVMKNTIKDLINEIKMMSENAIEGRLSVRGNTNKFKGDYQNIVDGVNKTLDAVVQPIKESSAVLEEMSKSNLQVEVQGNYKGDHAVIKDAINNTLAAFNEVLGNINSASEQVASGAKQVSASSQALSQSSTEQASSIEEITASIEEIASQTRQNAANANQTNEFASTAKEKAVQGNMQMSEMLKAMAEINESSSNISKIIKVIDEIAFQTNILALNAAVEAARAGQHGKGFAVVAEEVRNLAARSADAAKETTAMIEGSIKKVDTGTKIANDTAVALNQILESVEKAAALVGEIADASNEQASGISQVNKAIAQVAQVVQTNSATSEESAAASEELSSQADLLSALVGKYKLNRISSNKSNTASLTPEILKMLEDMASKKPPSSHQEYRAQEVSKVKIALDDKDFGKYL